jgi:hypothetical protein
MMRTSLRPYYVMGTLIAVCLTVTAAAGLFVKGIYAPFLSDELVAFQYFQDLVSLMFAPLLVAAMLFTGRGSRRAIVLWAALLVYVLYYYSFYGLGMVYTGVYPLYVALMGLSAYSLAGLLHGVDLNAFQQRIRDSMPVRFISLVLAMTVLFVPLWLSILSQRMQSQQAEETDLVFVLDLAFLIPATVFTAIQIWRRRPAGYLLSGVLLIKATVTGMLLTGSTLLQAQFGLPLAVDQLALYVFLATAGSISLGLYMRHLEGDRAALHPKHALTHNGIVEPNLS